MEKLDEKEKKYLLELARRSIEYYMLNKDVLIIEPKEVPSKKLIENASSFVTLYIGDRLRGCIGHLEPKRALVFDVIESAAAAAFNDPRFKPLVYNELEKLRIVISVLEPPVKVEFEAPEEILEKLVPGKTGLILKKEWHRATYLPGVWEELPKKDLFLSELCKKAGLPGDEWKKPGMEYWTYEVQEFSE
ncbi:AmmeMemoRadiSam system protein A [Candidatus Micrarchaeota archaeon]|nr:AmmeMemoRadiSam system protein A [Candidatus Micrarchaeota archaeon]